jgi:hypothetical protein
MAGQVEGQAAELRPNGPVMISLPVRDELELPCTKMTGRPVPSLCA